MRLIAAEGKETLIRKFSHLNIHFNSQNVGTLEKFYKLKSATDLYIRIAKGTLDLSQLKKIECDWWNCHTSEETSNKE